MIILIFLFRIKKPNEGDEKKDEYEYYGPSDFHIGAIIHVFGSRFIITEVDEHVIKYAKAHRSVFSEELIENLSSGVTLVSRPGSSDAEHKICNQRQPLKFRRL